VLTIETPAPALVVTSPSFSVEQAAQSTLCLEVGADFFRFLVVGSTGRVEHLEEYTFHSLLRQTTVPDLLPGVYASHPVLSADRWGAVRVSVHSASFTLVPAALFRKEYAASYLALMRGSALSEFELAQTFLHTDGDFYSVFCIDWAIADFLRDAYPFQSPTLLHQTSALLLATANIDRRQLGRPTVSLYFENEYVTVIHRRGGKLQYINRFGYKTPSDLAYYVLYVLEELHLLPAEVTALLYGEITPYAEQYTQLSRFLPNLTLGHYPPTLRLADAFGDLPEHRYLSLFGLVQPEL
jgi:Protein of unknown function (DUF3822)